MLAFFGIGGASGSAAASETMPLPSSNHPEFPWRLVEESRTTWPDGAWNQTVQELDVVRGDWRVTGRLIHMRRPSGSFWRFEVEVDANIDDPDPELRDPKTASSWNSTIEETQDRAELAILLLLDLKRLENHEMGPVSSFRPLSSR